VAAPKRRPRGHIRELPSGSFQAIVYAGTDPLTGEPRPLRETAKTCAGAATALTRLQSQVDENRHPKSDITVGQAIALIATADTGSGYLIPIRLANVGDNPGVVEVELIVGECSSSWRVVR
jgi:hypothetical protein